MKTRAHNVDPKWERCQRRPGGEWWFTKLLSAQGQLVKAPNRDVIPQRLDGAWYWVYPEGCEPEEDPYAAD